MKPLPPVATGFAWRETAIGPVLVSEGLESFAQHLFTTRAVRFRESEEADHYRRLAHVFDLAEEQLVTVNQVHGRNVSLVQPGDGPGCGAEADAIVSTLPDVLAVIRTADCVPLLLADREGRAVAAVHAGWRGTAAGAARAAVEAFATLSIPPSAIVAAIGPSVGPCCYQVDTPVREALRAAEPNAESWFVDDPEPGKWRLDLWEANRAQLIAAGVPRGAIAVAGLCTAHHPEHFFSYRREGKGTGRIVGAIKLNRTPR